MHTHSHVGRSHSSQQVFLHFYCCKPEAVEKRRFNKKEGVIAMHEPGSQVYIKKRLGRPGCSNKESWKRKIKIMEKEKGRFTTDLQDGK